MEADQLAQIVLIVGGSATLLTAITTFVVALFKGRDDNKRLKIDEETHDLTLAERVNVLTVGLVETLKKDIESLKKQLEEEEDKHLETMREKSRLENVVRSLVVVIKLNILKRNETLSHITAHKQCIDFNNSILEMIDTIAGEQKPGDTL